MKKIKDEAVVVEQSQPEEEWKDKYLRAAADYHNLEQRVGRQVAEAHTRGVERMCLQLLTVLDDMRQAEKFVTDPGLVLVKAKLEQVLITEGLKEIEVKGKPFDPETSECIEVVEGEDGMVIDVHQAGYMLGDRLIRPAKVSVGKIINH